MSKFQPSHGRAYGGEYGRITDLQKMLRSQADEIIGEAQRRLNTGQLLTPGQSPMVRSEAHSAPNDTYAAGHKTAIWLAAAAQHGHKELLAAAKDIEAGVRRVEDQETWPFYRPGFSEDPAEIQRWYDRGIKALDAVGGRNKKHFKGIYYIFGVHTNPTEQQNRRELLKEQAPLTTYVDNKVKEKVPAYTAPEDVKTPDEEKDEERNKQLLIYGTIALGVAGGIYWAMSGD